MWVMSGHCILFPRLLFVFVCAAVASFVMCSDSTGVENGQKQNLVHPVSKTSSPHLPLSTGLLPEVDIVASSILYRQSDPLLFTERSSGSSQDSPDNRQYRGRGMKPASNTFTGRFQPSLEGLRSRVNHQQKLNNDALNGHFFRPSAFHSTAQTRNPLYSHPPIIRKPSNTDLFHQTSSLPQVPMFKDAWKLYSRDKTPHRGSSSTIDRQSEAKSAPDAGFSFRTGRFRSWLPHSGGHKETNELSGGSNGIPSGKSHVLSRAPSVTNGLDSTVLEHNPSSEKSSNKDSSLGSFSQKKPNFIRVQLNLLKNPQTLKTPKAQENSFNDPHNIRNPGSLDQLSAQTMKHFNPTPLDFRVDSTDDVEKPGPSLKSIHRFNGFKSSHWRPSKENSDQTVPPFDRTNYNANRNRLRNLYPSLFSQRKMTLTSQTPTTASSTVSAELRTMILKTSAPIEAHPRLPENSTTNFQSYKRVYQLQGFQSPQLGNFKVERGEGVELAKVEMVEQGLEFPQSGRIDQPQIKSTENKVKDLLMSAGNVEKLIAERYKNYPPDYGIGDTSTKIRSNFVAENPTVVVSETLIVNSTLLRPTGDLNVDLQPRTPGKTRLPGLKEILVLNTRTSSTVRGTRVMGNAKKSRGFLTVSSVGGPIIIRKPEKPPIVIEAIAYADVAGSASFSKVNPTQMSMEDDTKNETGTTEQRRK